MKESGKKQRFYMQVKESNITMISNAGLDQREVRAWLILGNSSGRAIIIYQSCWYLK